MEFDLFYDDSSAPFVPEPIKRLREYQDEAASAVISALREHRGVVAVMATGCFAKGTPVLLADGRILPIEKIKIGDNVMGPDSRPRRVTALARGREKMYRITPIKGATHDVNESHVLTLVNIGRRGQSPRIVDIPLRDYLCLPKHERHLLKLFRPQVTEFQRQHELLPLSPYFLGVFIGDGSCLEHSNGRWVLLKNAQITTADESIKKAVFAEAALFDQVIRIEEMRGNAACNLHIISPVRTGHGKSRNYIAQLIRHLGLAVRSEFKFIPDAYKFGSIATRLAILAGLIDTDGSASCGGFDYISKSRRLADDVAFVARSLGLAAYVRSCTKSCQTGASGTYHRVSISGDCSIVPTRVPRKRIPSRRQKKSVLRTGFSVSQLGDDYYYGFELAGTDGRFLLGDFTVTHNTGKTVVFAHLTKHYTGITDKNTGEKGRVLVLAHADELIEQARDKLAKVLGMPVSKEKAQDRASLHDQVVVASVQTLRGARLRSWPPNHFTLIVVDEAHHVMAATYQEIIAHFAPAKVLGVTATLTRGDKKELRKVFSCVAFDYGLRRAVADGWLVRPLGMVMPFKPDFGKLDTRAGDFVVEQVAHRLTPYLDEIARVSHAEIAHLNPTMMAFLPNVATAQLMADCLGRAGFRAAAVWGADPQRYEKIEALRRGELNAICNPMVLCLDLETEILTESGWVTHETITPNHRVANWQPDGSVFFDYPREIVKRPLGPDERMVCVQSYRTDIRVTDTHRMIVGSGVANSHWKKIPARDLSKRHVLPACGVASPSDVVMPTIHRERNNRRITANAYALRKIGLGRDESRVEATRRENERCRLRYKQPSELSLDECRLIGFWIADGSATRPKRGGVEYVLCQSPRYPTIVAWVDNLLDRVGVNVVRRVRMTGPRAVIWSLCRGTGGGSQQRKGLFSIEPYLQKNGTCLFWGLNERQFDALVEGYWYGDGYHGQALNGMPRSVAFSETKRPWVDLLTAIGSVRGWRCAMYPRPSRNPRHKDQWYLRMIKGAKITLSERTNITHEQPQHETVWCVKTTSKNIITRRRGKVVVMGNTEGFDLDRVDTVLPLRLTKLWGLYAQMAGRATRPLAEIIPALNAATRAAERRQIIARSAKPHARVLDFLGLYEGHASDMMRPAHLVAPSEEVARQMRNDGDLLENEEAGERSLFAALEKALDEASKTKRKAQTLDPFKAILAAGDKEEAEEQMNYEPMSEREALEVTPGQLSTLQKFGIDTAKIKDRGHASRVITWIFARLDKGLCDPRTLVFLKRQGIDASAMPAAEARKLKEEYLKRFRERKAGQRTLEL